MQTLSVVIVNWNTRELVLDCLRHLDGMSTAEILVVDNGSKDGSADAIEKHFPRVKLIRNPTNTGYAAANNQGWKASGGELVLLLNSDTRPEVSSIEAMARHLAADSALGVAGPFLRLENGQPQVGAAGWDLGLASALWYNTFLSRLFPRFCKGFYLHQPAFSREDAVRVDWVSGAAMMTRRKVLEQVGGIPEHYFMYAEDVDFCARVRHAGYRVEYMPAVSIEHLHGASAKNSPEVNVRWLQSTFGFYQQSHGTTALRLLALTFTFGSLVRLAAHLPLAMARRSSQRRVRQYLKYLETSFATVVHGK